MPEVKCRTCFRVFALASVVIYRTALHEISRVSLEECFVKVLRFYLFDSIASYRGTFAWIYARDWIVQMYFLLFYSIKVNYCCYSAYFVLFCFNKALTRHLRAMYILICSFDADWRQNKGLCGMPLSHSALIKINCVPGKSPLAVFSPDASS